MAEGDNATGGAVGTAADDTGGVAGEIGDTGGSRGSVAQEENAGTGGSSGETNDLDKADGLECLRNAECLSHTCTTFFKDEDADGYGSQLATETAAFCGTAPPPGYSSNSGDCCDSDKNAKPGQPSFFPASNGCGSFDYNCNATEDIDPQQKHVAVETCDVSTKSCSVTAGWVAKQAAACGDDFYWRTGTCLYIASEGSCSYARDVQVLRCH